MELIEIRDLDGPNVFLLVPAIKIELRVNRQDLSPATILAIRGRLAPLGVNDQSSGDGVGALGDMLEALVRRIHRVNGVEEPNVLWQELEMADHMVLAFSWTMRRFALEVARLTADVALGPVPPLAERIERIADLATDTPRPDDTPSYLRDADRRIPIIGVSGTNGKTTTTRLCAHILGESGRRVGWTTTAGVYIDGDRVLEGDYSGPQGAHKVLSQPNLDVAVLESARGGILLRGLAYESNDISVFLNVSADHLGLLGIQTVEGLAMVKATVVRVTRPEGWAVLNADDPLVRGIAGDARARILYVSQDAANPTVVDHAASGGAALIVDRDQIVLLRDGQRMDLVSLDRVPITIDGRAAHMVENALCAGAACLAFGLTLREVADGLTSFRNSPEQNRGRLNIFELGGFRVIVDYAHNGVGLDYLLKLSRTLVDEAGRLVAVIGTAGDRSDEALRELGRIAGEASDEVIVKETQKYLRGRASGAEMSRLMVEGVNAVGKVAAIAPTELDGLLLSIQGRGPGDVVAMMCIEQLDEVLNELSQRGPPVS